MTIRKNITAKIVLAAGLLTVCACGKSEEKERGNVHIGVAYYDQQDTF